MGHQLAVYRQYIQVLDRPYHSTPLKQDITYIIVINMQNSNRTILSWEYASNLFGNKPTCSLATLLLHGVNFSSATLKFNTERERERERKRERERERERERDSIYLCIYIYTYLCNIVMK